VISVHDLRPLDLFRGLTGEQLDELVGAATEVGIRPGDQLFSEGEAADSWWVLLDGALDLVRRVGREEVIVARMDAPGRWAGGFRAWDGGGTYLATGRCVLAGRMLRVPAARLRQLADDWFPFARHLITGLYHTARSIESTARQRDSLITLGTLAAGLAHEINNPASAAVRDVTLLQQAFAMLLESRSYLGPAEITPTRAAALERLRQEIAGLAAPVDPLDRADRQQALTEWLRRHGVTSGWALASALAGSGVDLSWCERVFDLLDGAPLEPALERVVTTLTIDSLLVELAESTHRIVDLVSAVRSYTQLDRASRQRVDLVEGLESTLSMLRHRLGDGIEVERELERALPLIDAYPGELNQVWTNLIDNAVDAMDGSGRLRISARVDDEAVVVEIADTGPGMAPEVAAHAFETFFTTKEVGKGTGLGLDIARRIVEERHGGSISIERRAAADQGRDETILRVRLPVERAD